MNRSCFLSLATCRTPRNPWDTRSPLCVGLVLDCAMFSLARALPSPTSAEGLLLFVRQVHRYYGAVRLLRSVPRPLYGFSPFRTGLDPGWIREVPEVSRFSCMLFLSVRGFLDYAGPTDHSRYTRPAVLPSPLGDGVGALIKSFSKLNSPAHRYPCLRFERHLAASLARLRAKMESLSPFL